MLTSKWASPETDQSVNFLGLISGNVSLTFDRNFSETVGQLFKINQFSFWLLFDKRISLQAGLSMGLRWFCCRDSLFTVLLCYLMCSDVFFCKAADPWNVYEQNSDSLSERIITIKMPGTRPLKASTHRIFTSLDDIKLTREFFICFCDDVLIFFHSLVLKDLHLLSYDTYKRDIRSF